MDALSRAQFIPHTHVRTHTHRVMGPRGIPVPREPDAMERRMDGRIGLTSPQQSNYAMPHHVLVATQGEIF